MFKILIISLLLFITISSCSRQKRTYLTDGQKGWNPYKKGEILIFKSSNPEKDTISIEDVGSHFPDGPAIITNNERLDVLAKHIDPLNNGYSKTYLFRVIAKSEKMPSYIKFGLKAKGSQFFDQRYSLDTLRKFPEIEISILYGSFSDVIEIDSKRDYSNVPTAIERLYWSKSRGYIRFDKYDGTSWELLDIIEPNSL